jgi:hypothetical protein
MHSHQRCAYAGDMFALLFDLLLIDIWAIILGMECQKILLPFCSLSLVEISLFGQPDMIFRKHFHTVAHEDPYVHWYRNIKI